MVKCVETGRDIEWSTQGCVEGLCGGVVWRGCVEGLCGGGLCGGVVWRGCVGGGVVQNQCKSEVAVD